MEQSSNHFLFFFLMIRRPPRSTLFPYTTLDRVLDLVLLAHVVREEEELEGERVALRPDQAEVLLAPEHELADRRHARLLHRAQEQDVRPPRRIGRCGREAIRAVEVDGVDVLELHETEDLDRLRALERDRLEVGLLDEHELALRDLPALDELVGLDVALVERAPTLLLDRRAALAVQGAEGDVGPLGRQSEPDGDVDESEADGAVPDGPHDCPRSVEGPHLFALSPRVPAPRTMGPRGVSRRLNGTERRSRPAHRAGP